MGESASTMEKKPKADPDKANDSCHIIERNCESAFAQYLLWLVKSVDQKAYDIALRHILLYRDCLNEYGYLKLEQIEKEEGVDDDEEKK